MNDEPPKEHVNPDVWPPKPGLFTETQAVEIRFGRNWRQVLWFKNQFSRLSLTVIAGVLVSAGSYFMHLTGRLNDLDNRMQVLDGRIPNGDMAAHLEREIADDRVAIGQLTTRMEAQDQHLQYADAQVDRIYEVFDPRAVKELRPFARRDRK